MASKYIYEIYHETMYKAIQEAIRLATLKGYTVHEESITLEPISYETSRTIIYPIEKNGKMQRKCMNVTLYRMPSGKYELTTYIN
jgi:hypothetical protein